MKLSQIALVSATAVGAALAAPAAQTTVTEHVHQEHTATVRAAVYVDNGSTYTSLTTEQPSDAVATATASASEATGSVVVVVTTLYGSGAASSAPVSSAESTSSAPLVTAVAQKAAAVSETASESSEAATSSAASSADAGTSAAETSVAASTSSSAAPETTTVAATSESSTSSTSSPAKTSTSAAETSSSAAAETSISTSSPAATSSASSTSSSAAASSTSGSSSFASAILQAHNDKRSLHQDTSSLSWSDELASYAQDYADNYDCSGTLTHSGGPYGENLAAGYSGTGAVDAWYSEIKSYDWSDPNYSSSTGHFTQLVWKSTSEVGCGIKSCGSGTGDYVICSYKSAGNVIGSFAENVKSLN
ncbi:CAP domain-containing protein [Lachancea thermotolerans CBS 6340]|uniref:KLTH0H09834p n=1 Tax=Lachancea thermotolerans (strain ATCC 56472 / CBS 6340 / NRRL Y-8284) TaxID=559295 RepID=C5E330_LACTC|nr:KLTH0H09834p [Lachancea thermotolerans CBS 6340]CAR30441.1 KLTH0H09834p [Lachancea thermotolerans CBS 6340]